MCIIYIYVYVKLYVYSLVHVCMYLYEYMCSAAHECLRPDKEVYLFLARSLDSALIIQVFTFKSARARDANLGALGMRTIKISSARAHTHTQRFYNYSPDAVMNFNIYMHVYIYGPAKFFKSRSPRSLRTCI